MNKKIVLIGSGGHAKVIAEILIKTKNRPEYVVSPDINAEHSRMFFGGCLTLKNDESLLDFSTSEIDIVNGIGSLPYRNERYNFYNKFSNLGYSFRTVISPNAIISSSAEISAGVHIMSGAIIQSGVKIGSNTIINTGAVIDHDCSIGSNNHIAPGVVISGNVETGEQVHIGTNASVIQNIKIGSNSIIGAAAPVTKDIPSDHVLHPGKPFLIRKSYEE